MFKKYWRSSKNLNKEEEILYENNENNEKDKKDKILQDDVLTNYEKKEIKKFNKDKIYYYGDSKSKILTGVENFGFDNVNDCYIFRKNDHIYYRYKIDNKLGMGIWKCS